VLFVIILVLSIALYSLVYRFKVKTPAQYIWIFICFALYLSVTLQLGKHPEEALHLVEYSLLTYLIFKALSYRVRDRTVYLTSVFFVALVGIADEFIQWLLPGRVWDYKDIGINALAAGLFMLAVWKGFRPAKICQPVQKISLRLLSRIITINLVFLGLCLSNTPENVHRYTSIFESLSWLRHEEPMTEYGYKYDDPEIGIFYSRLPLDTLYDIDRENGAAYGNIFHHEIGSMDEFKKEIAEYNNPSRAFLYEFFIHVKRRESNLSDYTGENGTDMLRDAAINTAIRENMLVEKYFRNTLKHSIFAWPESRVLELKASESLGIRKYDRTVGKLITSFRLKTAWVTLVSVIVALWIFEKRWKRRLKRSYTLKC